MGTRADFYVGRGESAEWLGSIAWDGYPDGIDPEMGWPWPWDDSGTTDYAYAFEDGAVYASSFGHAWFRPNPDAPDFGEPEWDEHGNDLGSDATFPNMAERKAVTLGPRSGVIVVGGGDA
jgi:hypothetical protein